MQEAFSKQESLDNIVVSALLQVAQENEGNEGSNASEVSTEDEWFDVFRREAADRSAGDMREAFTRILAGEISRPGTFSVHSLRVLGTISTRTAETFRRAASVSIWMQAGPDARVPEVGGSLGENCLSDVGLSYDALTELMESGLLRTDLASRMPYGLIRLTHAPGMKHPTFAQLPFVHQGRLWIVKPSADKTRGRPVKVKGVAFTSAGRELLTVVDIDQMPEFTDRLKAHFAKLHYQMVELPRGHGI